MPGTTILSDDLKAIRLINIMTQMGCDCAKWPVIEPHAGTRSNWLDDPASDRVSDTLATDAEYLARVILGQNLLQMLIAQLPTGPLLFAHSTPEAPAIGRLICRQMLCSSVAISAYFTPPFSPPLSVILTAADGPIGIGDMGRCRGKY